MHGMRETEDDEVRYLILEERDRIFWLARRVCGRGNTERDSLWGSERERSGGGEMICMLSGEVVWDVVQL